MKNQNNDKKGVELGGINNMAGDENHRKSHDDKLPFNNKIHSNNVQIMEKEENTKTNKSSAKTALKVAGGVIAGAAVGGLAGVLLAPDSGKNTRKKIAEQAKEKAKEAKMSVMDKVEEVKTKLKPKEGETQKKKA